QGVRYDGVVSPAWLLQASYARSLYKVTETPQANITQVIDYTVTPTLRSGGIGAYEDGDRSLSNQFSVASSHVGHGHDIKYGFQSDALSYTQAVQQTGPTFVVPGGIRTSTGASVIVLSDPTFRKIYRATGASLTFPIATTQKYQAVFVQDSWRISDNFTVN